MFLKALLSLLTRLVYFIHIHLMASKSSYMFILKANL